MKHRRLTVGDRLKIQAMVSDKKYNITKIAEELNVNKSTISRELKNNSEKYFGFNTKCYILPKCGVCNSCSKRTICQKSRLIYNYKTAQNKSEFRASSSRSLARIEQDKIAIVDSIVKKGTDLGQSLHYIYVANPELKEICSERTIRRMCYRGDLTTKPHNLKRYVRYKREYKKTYKDIQLRNVRVLIGTTFEDFFEYIGPNKSKEWVEFDSVIGKITDRKAILTITFVKESFQFGLVISKGNAESVLRVLRNLFRKIGPK